MNPALKARFRLFRGVHLKGARAYFMQNILHDWEDKQASQILKYIPDAMEPGYSIVLVHQSIINSVKPLARGDDG
ncbi:hypothetical protein HZ326_26128 [Fusarium oxysporum f. sp. albedinis]|nr:hypothetical protein HZ326_26128 [Fusarium oxysporum f. sp. albedinis]